VHELAATAERSLHVDDGRVEAEGDGAVGLDVCEVLQQGNGGAVDERAVELGQARRAAACGGLVLFHGEAVLVGGLGSGSSGGLWMAVLGLVQEHELMVQVLEGEGVRVARLRLGSRRPRVVVVVVGSGSGVSTFRRE